MSEFTTKDAMALRFGTDHPVKKPMLKLVGEDGNAFSILARAQRALSRAGRGSEWDAFLKEATSGDYDHLLQTCMAWFEVE